uniref:Uncharacterized protein n=1 Tax=Anguilla anguilla TaxID=7936 RepID=A0A0E9RKC3_ANGAN
MSLACFFGSEMYPPVELKVNASLTGDSLTRV